MNYWVVFYFDAKKDDFAVMGIFVDREIADTFLKLVKLTASSVKPRLVKFGTDELIGMLHRIETKERNRGAEGDDLRSPI